MRQYISFDWTLKTILRDKANFVVLEGFLSELLGDDVSILEILESEGITDYKLLKFALSKYKGEYPQLDIEFLDIENIKNFGGSSLLEKFVDFQKDLPNDKIYICIFDRDECGIIKKHGMNRYNSHGNNVYSFCIPKFNEEIEKFSIEHYFSEEEIKTEDENGRRLFLGTEFHRKSMISECGKYCMQEKNKAGTCKIIDQNVFSTDNQGIITSVALSKNEFVYNIVHGKARFGDFDFSNFKKIFDIIQEIVNDQKETLHNSSK